MKRHWIVTCTTAVLALVVGVAVAAEPQGQGRGRGRGRGQEQQEQARARFNDHDREVTLSWYQSNQRNLPRGMRDRDRWAPTIEVQVQEGYVLDRRQRGQIYSVPSALLRLLSPAPRSYRYVVIGGHLILIDSGYRVVDIIHLGHGR